MTSSPTRTDEQLLGIIPKILPEWKSIQKTLDELQRKATVRQELEKRGLMQDVVELWRRDTPRWEETAAGEALHTLLEVSKPERRSYEAVVQALDCRFDGTENPLTLRQQLKDRFRRPGEPLGQFAADVRYLACQAYPEFPTAIQEELATDAFLHGLTPGAVRNQVRLDTPQTLDAALARAKLAEVVLGEQSPLPSTAKHPPRASTRRIQSTPMRSMELEPPPDARNDLSLPGKPETSICWRCGQRGHLRHNCGTLSPTSPSLQLGNDMGPM
ncbi:UNVERIFIED_CONTAM: hypothetical protein FKN15_008131 [Acipenser sinensis]